MMMRRRMLMMMIMTVDTMTEEREATSGSEKNRKSADHNYLTLSINSLYC